MMTAHTAEQILQVLRTYRDNRASGMPLHPSYREAVRSVAAMYSVSYQTIGDGCRRRLNLDGIDQFYKLLAAWDKGEPSGLIRQLKESADRSAHDEIDRFFSAARGSISDEPEAASTAPTSDPEMITFRLPAEEARMLRTVAGYEGVSVAELAAREVSIAVRKRMADIARTIINDAGDPEARGVPCPATNLAKPGMNLEDTAMASSDKAALLTAIRTAPASTSQRNNEVAEFANAIGAVDLRRLPDYEALFKRKGQNYFRLDKNKYLIVTVSRIEPPFWGVPREIIELFNTLTENGCTWFYVALVSSREGWVLSKEEFLHQMSRGEFGFQEKNCKIHSFNQRNRDGFSSPEEFLAKIGADR